MFNSSAHKQVGSGMFIVPSASLPNACLRESIDPKINPAIPGKRSKRKSTSLRPGQEGSIVKCIDKKEYRARFCTDEGQEKKMYKSVHICPMRGLGSMTASDGERRKKEIIAEHQANSPAKFEKSAALNLGLTFRTQAQWWLNHAKVRSRRPIQLSTETSWSNIVDDWLIPNFGEMLLACVNNSTGKLLVKLMLAKGRAAKPIQSVLGVMKLILASAVDSEGCNFTHGNGTMISWNYRLSSG